MKSTICYDDELMAALRNPDEAAEYLNAALADPDQEVFLLALRDVINARGGMSKLAGSAELNVSAFTGCCRNEEIPSFVPSTGCLPSWVFLLP